ncbi:MAG: sulfite exporter TauE/SafE family protein [Alphaproteobacteria bacterium]|nr:sulfite exporter TauE/SafE family protein [Alphaproteobacteria bacterium]
MWTPETLAFVAGTFFLAGLVKGVIGLGLPTISLALLTVAVGLKDALGLLLVPSFVTNLWQGAVGGALGPILRRLWPLLAAVCAGTWFGVGILARGEAALLSALLGVLLCAYAALSLAQFRVPPPGRYEAAVGLLVGAINGVLTGMTGSFVVPGVFYLQALGLKRDVLVQAMGVLFAVSSIALAVALSDRRLLSADVAWVSLAALLPALAGMALGQFLRRYLSEAGFRRVFLLSLFALGAWIALQGLR